MLKNTSRNRAYDSFVRSFIRYDGISLKTEDLETADTGLVRWYTPNRAFYWELMKQHNWFPFQMTLGTTIAEHEPYLYFIEQAVREEYPDNWKVFSELIKKEKEEIAKLFRYEKEVEEEPNEEVVLTKRVFREIKYIFAEFTHSLLDGIRLSLGHDRPDNFRIRRKLQEIFSFAPSSNTIRTTYQNIPKPDREPEITDLLMAAFFPFKKHLQNNYPYIYWEHIANLYAHFVVEITGQIMLGRDTFEQTVSYIIHNDMLEQAYSACAIIWRENDSDRETLLEHLPLDRLAE